jgi:hypothetical protein
MGEKVITPIYKLVGIWLMQENLQDLISVGEILSP